MIDKKCILVIIVAAIIFLIFGIFLGNSFTRPLIQTMEKLEAGEELWFVYTFSGKVTGVKDNIVFIDGGIKDPYGKPLHREAVIIKDTNILLEEVDKKDQIERFEQREREDFRRVCEYMESINWDPVAIPRTLLNQEIFKRDMVLSGYQEITLEEIMPGDNIVVSSSDNIAANVRFEANTIFIYRY